MRQCLVSILVLTLLSITGCSTVQEQGVMHDQQQMDSSMMHEHMVMIADIMTIMAKIMGTGKMTSEHQKQCADMIEGMSQMMREMSDPYEKGVQERHRKEIQEIEEEFDPFNNLYAPG